ncbi:LuxR family two component transcriptional regulator [Salana multivorans]|uniref:LuxR family two component transcriptional regulator n=1 Tax=Salana multivorans TaxID=120377 RepID=A0A3N2DDQ4_9MICO|nr:response regulator transcription factor [Salana multivorans]OJX97937.1 MAG: DNA-binding response regulator [Micrococcales bacterium 73-15]ROR97564.1 LuxR family two component transcriptional regulator [Salana multivorans]
MGDGTGDGGGARIRVALVDDQQLVRAGFAMVINSQPDMTVVVEASDGDQALRVLPSYDVDVVLMDVRMPGRDGISATEALLCAPRPAGHATPKVIILTTFDLDEYVFTAIKAGASGFLLKDTQPEDMLGAIRTVHAGDAVVAPSVTRRLIEHVAATLPATERTPLEALDDLTDREREVLVLIARGFTNSEIATELFVAEATVKTHVGRILAKLGARDRVQLVVTAYETGLVSPGA